MKKIFLSAACVAALISCGNSEESTTETHAPVVETVVEEELTVYPYFAGAEFDKSAALSNEEVATYLANFNGDTNEVAFSADIIDNCEKKGCWMNVNVAGKPVRVKFKDYDFFVPLDAAGHATTLNGTFNFDTLTVAHLRHLAADANASEDSIASITEPEYSVTFMASGVYVD